MSKPTDNQDKTKKVFEIIQEIIQKSSDGGYIYRGESAHYEKRKVSSSLYREYEGTELEHFISDIQKEILKEARTYTHETDEFNILSQLQHYGGKTNLIDFTTDYNISLFFACESEPKKNGRVILKKKENVNAYIRQPRIPAERIIAQKSVFIQPLKGFEEPDKVVCIPAELKKHILDHLREYHNISTKTIYNDLHGFIKTQKIHKSEYIKFLEGNRYIIKKEYDEAIKCYNEAVRLFPQFALVYNNRGFAKAKLGQYEEAIEDYDEAIEINPQYAEAYNNRGSTKTELGRYEEAIEDYDEAIEINPQYAEAYKNRGFAKTELGHHREAIKDYDKAIEINPQDALAYNNRGLTKTELGRYEKAIEDYDEAIDIDRQFALAYNNRGFAKTKLGRYEEAIEDCSKAIEINPQDALAYNNRGLTKTELGRYEKAIEDYDEAIDIDRQFALAYNNRGFAKTKLGRYEEAIEDCSKAIEINPQLEYAYYYRGIALLFLSEWESAKADLTTARQWFDIAYFFRGEYKSVTEFEKKLNSTLPTDIKALLNYKNRD